MGKLVARLNKLRVMLLHDLLLFWRDRKSLILVLITPFVILSILINIYNFSDVASTIRGVTLGVCDQEGTDIDVSSDIFKVSRFEGDCDGLVAQRVKQGEFRGGLTIPRDFQRNVQSGKGAVLTLYLDNAKPTTAVVLRDAIKAYVSDLNEKIGREFILNAWKNLDKLNDNLKLLVKNLDAVYPAAVVLQDRLHDTEKSIAQANLTGIQQTLDDTLLLLDSIDVVLTSVQAATGATAGGILEGGLPSIVPSINLSVAEGIPEFQVYQNTSSEFKSKYCTVPLMNMTLTNNIMNITNNLTNNMAVEACSLAARSDSLVQSLFEKVKAAEAQQENITASANNVFNSSAQLRSTIATVRELMNASGNQSLQAHENLNNAKESLQVLDKRLAGLLTDVKSLKSNIDAYLNQTVAITDELRKTTVVLDQYTSRDPAGILRPITVETKGAFEAKSEIFSRIPALMGIVLLFVTLLISSALIVNERKSGTMARIFLSPITMFLFIFEKAVYLFALCLLELFSMFVAIAVFRVGVVWSAEMLLLMFFASALYLMMGIFIGAISKSENTALLTCLVVAFPLMFLSGAFSPIELMTGIYRTLSPYLPLTIHIGALEKVMIYGTGLDTNALKLMAGMIAVFYVLSVLIIRKIPTLR
ncbi:ABC transporter permease [Candidatus Woesearchaeota archaeon]|nr:ABC transporter permease [Candidatus Woesearchaeota archaeon]